MSECDIALVQQIHKLYFGPVDWNKKEDPADIYSSANEPDWLLKPTIHSDAASKIQCFSMIYNETPWGTAL